MKILTDGSIQERCFSKWAMTCFNYDQEVIASYPDECLIKFNAFRWSQADVNNLVFSMKTDVLTLKPTSALELSYLELNSQKMLFNHKLFLSIQMIILVLAILAYVFI